MARSPVLWCLLLPSLLGGCSGSDAADGPAAYDPSFLDRSVDPCTDFYRFACGTWVAQHPAPSGYASARFFAGDSRENTYFWSLLQAMQSGALDLAQPRRYYDACLAARRSTSTRDDALTTLLGRVSQLSTLQDLPAVLSALHRSGVSALFYARAQIDGTDPTHYGLTLGGAGYSLTRHEYADETLAAQYRAHIAALSRLALPSSSAPLDSAAVFDLERAIAEASADDVTLRDPVATYNPIDLAGLAVAVPTFAWPSYLATLGIADTSRLALVDPAYFEVFSKLLGQLGVEQLRQYLTWRVLEAHASASAGPLIDEEFDFHQHILLGRTSAGSDEGNCLDATREQFGFQLAHHFVNRFVSPTLKPSAEALVSTIRTAMQHDFDAASWLDDATRARAGEKLDLLLNKVAYPERWPADPNLALASDSSFLGLRLWLIRGYRADDANSVGTAVDRSDFFLSPDTPNAAYRPQSNDITIALPILQTPFYGEARPAAFAYGGLGVVVGHELTHAFDDQGRHYDGSGAIADWWSESAAAEFEQRAQCLVDQYDAYEPVPGSHVNGSLTLGENIADLGGTRLAYAAFEALPGRSSSGGFSAEQQFFLALAQVHCSSYSPELQAQLLLSDPHSPDALRVNGVMRNLPEFAQAFSCAAGAALAPEDRCQIW